MTDVPTIAKWLSGKNILISGATGYIGKILLERILRSCPDVKMIYVLIRPKRGMSAHERFQKLMQNEFWTLLKWDYDFSKVVPIAADFSVSGMGLSNEDIMTLQDNVHIVYHGAASIKFTDPFEVAVKANTRLTLDMVELSKGMKNLELFVHISTAYANCNMWDIEEKVYPAPMDWRKAISLAETADPDHLRAVTPVLLGDFPNTYTMTKNLAEHVVWDHRDEIPVFIFRPVIVFSLGREPVPGWSDNIGGLEAGYYAIGKGIIRIMGFNNQIRNNICTGDVTVNGMLVGAWKVSCHSKVTGEAAARVVNSNYLNLTTEAAYKMGEEALEEQPLPDTIWREYYFHITNPTLYLVTHLVSDMLPAVIIEKTVKTLTGKKIPITKGLRTAYVLTAHLMEYFVRSNFNMSYRNLTEATDALSDGDKEIFYTQIVPDGQTEKDLIAKGIAQFSKLVKDRQLPLKERLRQRRQRFLIDRICRVIIIVCLLYNFPYSSVTQLMTRGVTFVENIHS